MYMVGLCAGWDLVWDISTMLSFSLWLLILFSMEGKDRCPRCGSRWVGRQMLSAGMGDEVLNLVSRCKCGCKQAEVWNVGAVRGFPGRLYSGVENGGVVRLGFAG